MAIIKDKQTTVSLWNSKEIAQVWSNEKLVYENAIPVGKTIWSGNNKGFDSVHFNQNYMHPLNSMIELEKPISKTKNGIQIQVSSKVVRFGSNAAWSRSKLESISKVIKIPKGTTKKIKIVSGYDLSMGEQNSYVYAKVLDETHIQLSNMNEINTTLYSWTDGTSDGSYSYWYAIIDSITAY